MPENGRPVYVSDVLALEERLMARIDRLEDKTARRLEALDSKLDAKADAEGVKALAARVDELEAQHQRWALPRSLGGAAVVSLVSAAIGAMVSRLLG